MPTGNGENFMDSEQLKTPKTDCALKVYKRILSAWIPGLLTLKTEGSVLKLTKLCLNN